LSSKKKERKKERKEEKGKKVWNDICVVQGFTKIRIFTMILCGDLQSSKQQQCRSDAWFRRL
jgi:hypothetical protein